VEWGGWVQRNPEANRALIGEVIDRIASGALSPVMPFLRPLTDAAAVCSELMERRALGKIAFVP
jgi:NADPH:quinone reductase